MRHLLDFTLFPQEPAFYSTYMFTNIKTHTIYSDKLQLSVIDLTQIEQATEKDRLYGLYDWAKLFKSTTWEEIKMLVANNKNLEEAAATAYQLTSDEEIRLQCETRRDYLIHEQYIQKKWRNMSRSLRKPGRRMPSTSRKVPSTNRLMKSFYKNTPY